MYSQNQGSVREAAKMSYYYPEEILMEILARLPVKSLVKFRTVSKSWYSLIGGPDFINTHLNLNKNNKFFLFEHNSIRFRHFFSLKHVDALDMDTSGFISLAIRGFCNGLICLSDFSNRNIILWNPSIKKSVTLPTYDITSPSVVGFGFDYRANDYKEVRILFKCNNHPPAVELFELSKGTWRQITCTVPTHLFFDYTSQASINGVVHWNAFDQSGVKGRLKSIVAFNMVDEVCHEMVLPDEVTDGSMIHRSIGIFEESLMVVAYHYDTHYNCRVWVMKEYGVAKSWVNQFNVNVGLGFCIVQSLMKNSELSLETTSKQLILDQKIKVVEFLSLSTLALYVGTYMESLVLLEGRPTDSCDAVTSKR